MFLCDTTEVTRRIPRQRSLTTNQLPAGQLVGMDVIDVVDVVDVVVLAHQVTSTDPSRCGDEMDPSSWNMWWLARPYRRTKSSHREYLALLDAQVLLPRPVTFAHS